MFQKLIVFSTESSDYEFPFYFLSLFLTGFISIILIIKKIDSLELQIKALSGKGLKPEQF